MLFRSDVTRADETQALIQKTQEKFGRLDVLVNNAGKGLYCQVENTSLPDFSEIFELNVFSVLDLTQKALPLLKESRGLIINISSVAGWVTVSKMAAYCASKYALNSLSEALRIELAPAGIHVLSVYPGVTNTDFSANAKMLDARPISYATQGRGIPAAVVARKIVRAAARRKKEIYITLENHFIVWTHFLFPRLFEWGLKTFVK